MNIKLWYLNVFLGLYLVPFIIDNILFHLPINYYYTFRMVSLWDIRSMTDKSINPVLQFKHPKVLTSSFFSAYGNKMISTCNDNNIRIFNTEQLNSAATSKLKI